MATPRVRTAVKCAIPHLNDHVNKIEGVSLVVVVVGGWVGWWVGHPLSK